MSMISAQIDELRRMADGQATYRDAIAVMLQAADTIWELRDDLQRANAAVQDAEHDESMAWDRVRKADAENAMLRELLDISSNMARDYDGDRRLLRRLVQDMWLQLLNAYDYKEVDDFADRMRELGVEVDDG